MRHSLTILVAAAFAGGAALSACASADSAPAQTSASASASAGRTCFFRSQVDGFQHVRNRKRGSDAVIVSVGPRRQYLFETLGPCPDINWSETIGFDQVGPGEICSGLDVDLVVPSPIGPQRCAVKMIRQITPEEAKAY
jgi:hypothetical protein